MTKQKAGLKAATDSTLDAALFMPGQLTMLPFWDDQLQQLINFTLWMAASQRTGRVGKDLLEIAKDGGASGFFLLDPQPLIDGVNRVRISGPEASPFCDRPFTLDVQFPQR